jgi:hypothetical protein
MNKTNKSNFWGGVGFLLLAGFLFSGFSSQAAPPDLADNAYSEIANYSGQFLISSQSAGAYDPERDKVYFWGGHPPGGGFPQPDEIFSWSPVDNSWAAPRPKSLAPSPYCVGAGPADNFYDEALHGYLKIGNLLNMKGQWYRVPKMTGVSQIFTPGDNDWHYLNTLGFPEGQPYTSINTGGCRAYDRNSGTVLYGTPASVAVGGAIFDTWRNSVTSMGGWNWLFPHTTTAAAVVFNPGDDKYYFYDGGTSARATKAYSARNNIWEDKSPATVPNEYEWNGTAWIQNPSYPPRAKASTAGTSMNAAGAWDEMNKKAIYFIPIAEPRAGTYQDWKPNDKRTDMDDSVRPTEAGGGYQGYRYTVLTKFSFDSGSFSSVPASGQVIIQGASRATIQAVEVSSGSFAGGDAAGVIYFKPESWNAGPFQAGPVNLYDANGSSLIKSSLCNLVNFQVGGTTGSTEPEWPTGNVIGTLIQDGTATWIAEAYIGQARLEIWAYDPAQNFWEKKNEIPGLLAHRAADITATYLSKHNLFFITDLSSLDGTGIGNKYYYYRYARGKILDYPKNPKIEVKESTVNLSWDSVAGASGYNIYKGEGDPNAAWKVVYSKLNASPVANNSFADSAVSGGKTYFYHITAINDGAESKYSPLVRTDARAIWDGYVQVVSSSEQNINWAPVDSAASYNVYRAPVAYSIYSQGADYGVKDFSPAAPMREVIRSIDRVGDFVKVNQSPISEARFSDTVDLTGGSPGTYKIYAYRVTSVNALGVESGPSAYWLTIPEQPRRLQWRENWSGSTGSVSLGWAPPSQSGMKYRVYFSTGGDGALMKEATSEAVTGTTYTIATLPKALSAVYVSAVDALGQEGPPSPRASIYRPALNLWNSFGYLEPWHVLTIDSTSPAAPAGILVR